LATNEGGENLGGDGWVREENDNHRCHNKVCEEVTLLALLEVLLLCQLDSQIDKEGCQDSKEWNQHCQDKRFIVAERNG
jgi:hypothetical protein